MREKWVEEKIIILYDVAEEILCLTEFLILEFFFNFKEFLWKLKNMCEKLKVISKFYESKICVQTSKTFSQKKIFFKENALNY